MAGRLLVERRLSIAGVTAIGVGFGFARYGYGLFLPDLRAEFDLSVSLTGVVASASYVGYLVALTLVGVLAARFGPRPLIMAAGLSAGLGMAMVAFAPGVEVLVPGLILAGMSSGWAWAPYSDAVDRMLPTTRRDRVLALLPCGTAFAVVVAGPLALVTAGGHWRYAWMVFAGTALLVTVYNARVLPGGPHPTKHGDAGTGTRMSLSVMLSWLARGSAIPIYLTALCYGLSGAVYWSFAVEAITDAIRTGGPVAPLFWTLMGLAGTAGIFTGTVIGWLGLRRSHVVLISAMALAITLLGAAPGNLAAITGSAVLYGSSFMAISGLLAVWSYQVFPEQPSTGMSATVFALGIGTIIGPAALGAVADRYGFPLALVVAGGLFALTLAARPAATPRPQRSVAEGPVTEGAVAKSGTEPDHENL
ncbi:MAG TPA: MFS transporter [Pseudonocardiaceae bacterium]|nr:MFS transporter [Pseudonocardiaceae bacterium]